MAAAGDAPPNLLGRAEERAVLDGVLADVRRGESRSLVLRGEAGIGKTTLLRHLVASAPDMTVARAVGAEAETELAFAGLHQLCRPLLERLPRLPAPQRQALEVVFGLRSGPAPDRFLVGLAILSLLSEAADERPLLCVVDDAQWLDRASALTLGFVTRRLLAERVGVVFAAREVGEELRSVPDLAVRGLSRPDARALLGAVVRLKLDERVEDRVIAETRGNPLALVELPQGLSVAELAGGFGIPGARGLPDRIRQSFARRLEALGDDARRLALIAAAEPVGDPLLLWRAAERLGVAPGAAEEAEARGLLAVGERVTFRHPLARSAVYGSATLEERRAAHLALAEVTERGADPDRRAWHLAAAAAGPDEQVAAELERSAGRARARGGVAAAAAFLGRAAELTPDPGTRADRALASARAHLQAGLFEAALGLLAVVEAEPVDAARRARADLLRAEVAFATDRGGAAPAMLLRAGRRVEPFDAELARAAHLQALSAAMFAGRLAAPGGRPRDVAAAIGAVAPAAGPRTVTDLLLAGWATLFAEGAAAATPVLREALRRFEDDAAPADQPHLLWLVTITAPVVWDQARREALSRRHLEIMRNNGALGELPLALSSRAYAHLFRGELGTAEALIDETRVAVEASGAGLTPWGAVALAALRGDGPGAAGVLDAAAADAARRGEGIGLTVVAWARALLLNGLGEHAAALAAARDAVKCPTNGAASVWAMAELVEAAARVGERDEARAVAARFTPIAQACGTEWALGVDARLSAVVATGESADERYREAIDRLGRCGMRVDLARAHLLYGEWLHGERRRADGRGHLRAALEHFTAMGTAGFAARASRGLLAGGADVATPARATAEELTAQERQIARLARDGLSNPEIGARLFLSPRTVEWHLRKVFGKLGVRSRRDLARALPRSESEPAPA